jgi:hypothetical protein
MRYIVGGMMVVFALAGVGLFLSGLFGLLRRMRARHRLRQVEGEIVRIEVRQQHGGSDGPRTMYFHYPEIRFRSEERGDETFLSEMGVGASTSTYAEGQKIGVLYDPDGKIPPMIDSWSSLWGPSLVQMVSGPVFVGGALLIYYAFGDRIFGK